jgi:hypothetical protein
MNTLNDDGRGKSKVLMDLDDVVPMGSNPRVRHGDEAMEHTIREVPIGKGLYGTLKHLQG